MVEPTLPTSAILRAGLDLTQQEQSDRFATLQAGDRIPARVLRLETEGRVLVDLAGRRTLAAATTELRVGQRLLLEVIDTAPQMLLRIVPPGRAGSGPTAATLHLAMPPGSPGVDELTTTIQRLVQTLGAAGGAGDDSAPVGQALERLGALFAPAPLADSTAALAQWLKTALEDNGLFLETRLGRLCTADRTPADAAAELLQRDLKAQLLLLRSSLAELPPDKFKAAQITAKQLTALKSVVHNLLGHIEQQQLQTVRHSAQPDNLQLMTYVLPTNDPQRPLQLKVFYPKRGSESESHGHHCVALLLDMDRLGIVRADLTLLERHLQIAFYVGNEDLRDWLEPQVREVAAVLDDLFQQVQIGVHVSQSRIARFASEDDTDAVGRVNIRA